MSRSTLTHALQSPLARRLIVAMLLFSATVALLTSAIQLYQEYRRDLDSVETRFRQIGEVHVPTLTQSMWARNDKEIQLQLEGMLRVPNIVYAAVEEAGQRHAQAGQRDAARAIERRYPMHHAHLGEPREIGTLTVVASLDSIYAQLMREAGWRLLNNALLTFLAALFIFVLFHRLVTRHLTTVADHLHRSDPASRIMPLTLERASTSTPDELDVLVASANNMQDKARTALSALRDSEARVRLLLDSTSEAIYGADTQGTCIFANPACVRMLGYASEADLIGRRIHDLIHHTHPDGRAYPIENCAVRIATLAGQACHRDDEVHWRADGTSFPVEYWAHPMYQNGELVGTVVAFVDISEHKQTEAELHRLAYFDSLTGLPNRMLFNDRLHQALTDARRHSRVVALMLLDIDRFKVVNDTLGHEAGDDLLRRSPPDSSTAFATATRYRDSAATSSP